MNKSVQLYTFFLFSSLLFLTGCIDEESGLSSRDGADGKNALVSVNSEPSGDNCVHGGQRIESGTDLNKNDKLDSDEVTATSYVCNGADGKDGLSALVDVTEEPAGQNCRDGGLRVNTGVDSNKNNTLEPAEVMQTGYVCRATGADIGWQASQYIGKGVQQGISRAHIAMDKNGNAIAVWPENQWMTDVEVEYIPGSPVTDSFEAGNVWVNHYIAGRGWGEAQRFDVDVPHPRGVATPKAVFNEDGSAVVVWVQTRAVEYSETLKSLAARRYVPGDGWGEIFLVYDTPDGPMGSWAEIYSLASDNNGDVLVYWNFYLLSDSNFYLFDRFTSDGWIADGRSMAERALGSGSYDPLGGRAVADASGNIIAVGGDSVSECEDTCIGWSWLRRYTPGSGWGERLELHKFKDGTEIVGSDDVVRLFARSGNPDVAVNAAGNATVVWWELNAAPAANSNTEVMIMASRFNATENSWSDARFVSQGSGMAALHPQSYQWTFNPTIRVVMAENGNALVAWRQIDKTRGNYDSGEIHIDLWSNQYSADSGWGTPQRIELMGMSVAADTTSFAMNLSVDNEVIAVWRQADNSVWSNRYVFGNGWGEAQRMDGKGEYVDLATDSNGNAMTLWTGASSSGDVKDVFANRYIAP